MRGKPAKKDQHKPSRNRRRIANMVTLYCGYTVYDHGGLYRMSIKRYETHHS